MDVCCLNRPFDDLSQERVYHETEATLSIVSRCDGDKWILLSSDTIDYELSRTSDDEKLLQIEDIYSSASMTAKLTDEAEKRAAYFRDCGIKLYDSFHLASAEAAGADVLLSTDDKFIKATNRLELGIKVINPLKFLMEGIEDE